MSVYLYCLIAVLFSYTRFKKQRISKFRPEARLFLFPNPFEADENPPFCSKCVPNCLDILKQKNLDSVNNANRNKLLNKLALFERPA